MVECCWLLQLSPLIWPCTKVGEAGGLSLLQSTDRNGQLFVPDISVHRSIAQGLTYHYHFCQLNSLIFHDNNKCITVNGQMTINVGTNNIATYVGW